jgi:hypothetical protein
MILSGQPYRPPGAPEKLPGSQLVTAMRDIQIAESKDVEIITLALAALGSFDFTGIFR